VALPPRLEAPGELAMRAARCLDMPLSLSASYCFSFFTLGRLSGVGASYLWPRALASSSRPILDRPGRPFRLASS
jgi:hypothetical protein